MPQPTSDNVDRHAFTEEADSMSAAKVVKAQPFKAERCSAPFKYGRDRMVITW